MPRTVVILGLFLLLSQSFRVVFVGGLQGGCRARGVDCGGGDAKGSNNVVVIATMAQRLICVIGKLA